MKDLEFVQTSSILNRLRLVMVAIAVFILLSFFTIYLSSQGLFTNLQTLNLDNNILNFTSQALESLNSSELRQAELVTINNIPDLRYRFNENMKVSDSLVKKSMELAREKKHLAPLFNNATESLSHYRASNELLFRKLITLKDLKNKKVQDEISADSLASRQYLLDAKEQLVKIQINVKKDNDLVFNNLYKNRFRPLIVGVFLTTLFFTFVLTFGFSISRKIGTSLSNLIVATDKVAQGQLDYQATILRHDEIGRLTNAFNKMTANLKKGSMELNTAVSRTQRLQQITAAFSEALTPEQVYNVIFEHAFTSMPVIQGSVLTLSEDKKFLHLQRVIGIDPKIAERWKTFPVSKDVPVNHILRFGKPLFLTTQELKNYKDIDLSSLEGKELYHAYLPLIIGGNVLGVLTITFDMATTFGEPEKEFVYALARQCAQALHRSQLYEDAKKAIEARDEFLSIASHELRTPLTPLKLQLQGLERHIKRGTVDQLPLEKMLNMIRTSDRQINRLSTLIDDLLDVSRITTGKLSLNRENFSLKEMINEVIVQYSLQLKNAQSNVDVVIEDDIVGNWDKVRIEQVVINLLTNAAKYAPNKPIHVKVGRDRDKGVIEVRDEGPGIAPQDQERIFKRFERVISKNNVGGLGLGLYISKQIIEAHHGKLSVESVLGEGALFRIELPILSKESLS